MRSAGIGSPVGDSGIAVGAAYYVWNQELGRPRGFVMRHPYTGPEYPDADYEAAVRLRTMQVYRDRRDGHVRQHERDDKIAPPRQGHQAGGEKRKDVKTH